ncbi:sulfotransferase domain-containing protein [uncultured Cohaesibacter sp.]|uniref:sulfotransferase domain-containing protein n=1 Tax=uncultured Cohaesibacter sp. TaxID=1002546 RepID=UPI0029C95912|nr:sulfotransferase domain-containing protein [uncultured Cohaesibacter sp.]
MSENSPDFIGIGAQKSGTTFLFEALRHCPGVNFPAMPRKFDFLSKSKVDGVVLNTLPKEIQFLVGPNKELSWDQYLEVFSQTPEGEVAGEISPSYMRAPRERIEQLHQHCPNVKLFAIFRNPIERDWSAIRMIAKRLGQLEDEAALLDVAVMPQVIEMGDYITPLKRWFEVFPRTAFSFHMTDEIDADPKPVVKKLLAHIGLDGDHLGKIKEDKVFVGPSKQCPTSVKDILLKRHENTLEEFADLTGLQIDHWF